MKQDKLYHFVAGLVTFLIMFFLLGRDAALAVTLVVGFLKEGLWDFLLDKGKPDVLDFFATALPAIVLWFVL